MESDKDQQKKSAAPENSVPVGKGFMWTQLTLRSLAIAFALCSITITVTSDQSVHAYGMVLHTSYKYASSFKFLVGANAAMTALMISGCAAATAIGYVGRYGQNKSGWLPICARTPNFCLRMTLALAFSYLSFFSLLALTLVSAYKLKSLATTTL
ncbi:hypothetical protein LguiA_019760 [Lonicera macranthoides]